MKRLLVIRYLPLVLIVFGGSVPWLVCLWLASFRRILWSVPLVGIALYALVIYGVWRVFRSRVWKAGGEQDPT
jgi:hypothetical protein